MASLRREVEFERKKDKIIEEKGYTIFEPIGTRQNTLITLAFDSRNNVLVVLKEIHIQSEIQAQLALNEIRILASINSEFVAKYIDHFFVEKRVIFLVQEYVEGVDLFKRINVNRYQQLTELDIERIFIQVLQGLHYLHSVNIIHGDVRLESIVLQEQNHEKKCKFVSLEFSRFDTDIQIEKQNSLYTPPESQKDGIMGYKSDLWQAGCLFYQLLQKGAHPFYDKDEQKISQLIKSGRFVSVANFEFNEIIKILLNSIPENRPECIEFNRFFDLGLDYRPGIIRKRYPIQFDQEQLDQEQQQQYNNNNNNQNNHSRIIQRRLPAAQQRPIIVQYQPLFVQQQPLLVSPQASRLNTTQSVDFIQSQRAIIPTIQIINRPFYVINSTRRR